MSEREKQRTIREMEAFEATQRARGRRPSKTWLAMKRAVGSVKIHDVSILD